MGCGGSRADAIEPRYYESWTRETESTWLTNTDSESPPQEGGSAEGPGREQGGPLPGECGEASGHRGEGTAATRICVHLHTLCVHLCTLSVHLHTLCVHLHILCVHLHTMCVHLHTVCAHLHTLCVHLHTLYIHVQTLYVHLHTHGMCAREVCPIHPFSCSEKSEFRHSGPPKKCRRPGLRWSRGGSESSERPRAAPGPGSARSGPAELRVPELVRALETRSRRCSAARRAYRHRQLWNNVIEGKRTRSLRLLLWNTWLFLLQDK